MTRYDAISAEVRSWCAMLDHRDDEELRRRVRALLAMRGANPANVGSALAGHLSRMEAPRRERGLALAKESDPRLGRYLDLWAKVLGVAS